MRQAKQRIVDFNSIEDKYASANQVMKKGLGLSIKTSTGIIALTRRETVDLGVKNTPVEIIGRFLNGPLKDEHVELGRGEMLLRHTSGPSEGGNIVFFKFKEMSDGQKAKALSEFGK